MTLVARGYAGRALEVRVLEDGRLLRVLEATADDDVPVLHRLAVAPPPERAPGAESGAALPRRGVTGQVEGGAARALLSLQPEAEGQRGAGQ